MFSDNESNLSPAELDYLYHDDGPLYMHSNQSASSGPRRSNPPQPVKNEKDTKDTFWGRAALGLLMILCWPAAIPVFLVLFLSDSL